MLPIKTVGGITTAMNGLGSFICELIIAERKSVLVEINKLENIVDVIVFFLIFIIESTGIKLLLILMIFSSIILYLPIVFSPLFK